MLLILSIMGKHNTNSFIKNYDHFMHSQVIGSVINLLHNIHENLNVIIHMHISYFSHSLDLCCGYLLTVGIYYHFESIYLWVGLKPIFTSHRFWFWLKHSLCIEFVLTPSGDIHFKSSSMFRSTKLTLNLECSNLSSACNLT